MNLQKSQVYITNKKSAAFNVFFVYKYFLYINVKYFAFLFHFSNLVKQITEGMSVRKREKKQSIRPAKRLKSSVHKNHVRGFWDDQKSEQSKTLWMPTRYSSQNIWWFMPQTDSSFCVSIAQGMPMAAYYSLGGKVEEEQTPKKKQVD